MNAFTLKNFYIQYDLPTVDSIFDALPRRTTIFFVRLK